MTKTFHSLAAVLIGLIAALLGPAEAKKGLRQELVTVQVRPGTTMTYLGMVGREKPAAAVVLLAGGNGVLGLGPGSSIGTNLRLNFLIRSRELFARQGFYAAALDAPSDREKGMNGAYRLSLQHAGEIGEVIAHLKRRLDVPVWLVGTSSSSISAVNAAARLPVATLPGADGIVMTSSQTVLTPHCGRTVHDTPRSPPSACRCSSSRIAMIAANAAPPPGGRADRRAEFSGVGSRPCPGPARHAHSTASLASRSGL